MANNEYMPVQALKNVTTGWCNIQNPDDTFFQRGKSKSKPPQWKVEVLVDRENEEMMSLFTSLRNHLIEHGEELAEGEEPWVRVKEEITKRNKDGEEVTYPAYEYLSIMTTKDPHEAGIIVGENNKPFTDEVYNKSGISVAFTPKYDTVHKYLITFYLEGLKVHRNGTGGGGSSGKAAALSLIGVPFGGGAESPEDAPAEGAPFDPSQL